MDKLRKKPERGEGEGEGGGCPTNHKIKGATGDDRDVRARIERDDNWERGSRPVRRKTPGGALANFRI